MGDDAVLDFACRLAAVGESTLCCRTLVCFSTVSPACATSAEQVCKVRKVRLVCCPVTGRPEAAERGALVAWVSSSNGAASALVEELICPSVVRHVEILSTKDVSAAATYKLLTNFLIYGGVQLLAEATALAERSGAGRGAIARWFELMMPGTVYAGYAAKLREASYGGEGAVGAGLDVGIKDMSLIHEVLAGGNANGLPTLSATLENMCAARERVGGEAAASRFEWCVLAREVEMRTLGFTSAVPKGNANERPSSAKHGHAQQSDHPAGFAPATSKRISL